MGGSETPLRGGKLNPVVRVGDTVRRPAGQWTPTVHALLTHVRTRGFAVAPEPLGFDEEGREILAYVPGETVGDSLPWPRWVWDEDLLAQIGRTAAEYHRAVHDFRPRGVVPWFLGAAELGPGQIVCHHDMAPYNVVVEGGRLHAVIDWDLIGPGTVRSELAFIAWQWVPLQHPAIARYFGWHAAPDYKRRLTVLLDSYGLEDRRGFIDDVIERVLFNRDAMVRKAAEGDPAYMRLLQEGHVSGMELAVEFLSEHRERLQAEIL